MNKPRKSLTRRLAGALVQRWVGRAYVEEFIGDLDEMYEDRHLERGRFIAEVMYCVDAIHLVSGFLSVEKRQTHPMFIKNMIKVAWRSAVRQTQFTVLNLLGLTLGIATCLAIGLYVYDECTFDAFHTNGDRIYRINQPLIWGDWSEQFAGTGPGVALAIRTDIPDFEEVTRIMVPGQHLMRRADGKQATFFNESKYFGAEENFFKVFSFPFLKGDPYTSLKEPNTMVITASTAKRYFGDEDPMGQLIEARSSTDARTLFTVTGVLADPPPQSHLQFDMLGSLYSVPELKDSEATWIWTVFGTYGLIKEGTDVAALTDKLQALPRKWAERTTQGVFNQTFDQFTKGQPWTLYLQPLRSIYLAESPVHNHFGPSGNPAFVKIFGSIGLLVLGLSLINFMNLSTARSSNRAKEVGVRKVLGSDKMGLVHQFVVESVMYVTIGTVVALILVQLSLNAFNTIAEKQLQLLPLLTDPYFVAIVVVFILVVGLAAGSYPAFYLSALQPVSTLKGKLRAGFKGKGVRNVLVVFQFTVSVALIICTFFVQRQLTYASRLDLGISKDHVLQIHDMHRLGDGADVLKDRLRNDPTFTIVAKSGLTPPGIWTSDRYRADGPDQPVVDIYYMRCDEDYLPLLQAEFITGRNFEVGNAADKYNIIINEETARLLGYGSKENWADRSPVGDFIVQSFGSQEKLQIIGVVKDFNFNGFKQKIQPLLIMRNDNDKHWSHGVGFPSYLSMRINPTAVRNGADLQHIIDGVKTEVAKIDPSLMFNYSFMDEEFENTFRGERRMSLVLNIFTILAIVIACLGLFGLAAFSADQKKKELGIRKLHGASSRQLVILFSSEFTRLIVLSIAMATPIAYLMTDRWLSSFAYRTPIDLWVFVASGLIAIAIALFTVAFQSFSAANANPVEVLRSE